MFCDKRYALSGPRDAGRVERLADPTAKDATQLNIEFHGQAKLDMAMEHQISDTTLLCHGFKFQVYEIVVFSDSSLWPTELGRWNESSLARWRPLKIEAKGIIARPSLLS